MLITTYLQLINNGIIRFATSPGDRLMEHWRLCLWWPLPGFLTDAWSQVGLLTMRHGTYFRIMAWLEAPVFVGKFAQNQFLLRLPFIRGSKLSFWDKSWWGSSPARVTSRYLSGGGKQKRWWWHHEPLHFSVPASCKQVHGFATARHEVPQIWGVYCLIS